MYNFQAFHRSFKAEMVILVVKPWEVIKVYVSMYRSMLDIVSSHYEHVLGPYRFFLTFEKNNFTRKHRSIFNGL